MKADFKKMQTGILISLLALVWVYQFVLEESNMISI